MQFNNIRAFLCITAIMASAAIGRAAQIGSVEQGSAIARVRRVPPDRKGEWPLDE
jgi:hypothetical protein